ncbi:MAG: helix-turn-helix transcriptional regulator [Oscillospiraceae bacterium]|nr:helix-turn-helix transcriptional regulator [Oscillospiraceae bacterium]
MRLQSARKMRGITQEELSSRLGLSGKQHISRIERGERSCSIDLLVELSYALHVSTDYLLKGEDPARERNKSNVKMKLNIYEDFKSEVITMDEYTIFKEDCDKKIQEAKTAIARLQGNRNQVKSGLTEQQSWLAQFREYKNIKTLTRRVIVHFVDKIGISANREIHVVLNNADQFQAISEFLDERQMNPAGRKTKARKKEVG